MQSTTLFSDPVPNTQFESSYTFCPVAERRGFIAGEAIAVHPISRLMQRALLRRIALLGLQSTQQQKASMYAS